MLERIQDAPAEMLALRASGTILAQDIEAAIEVGFGRVDGGARPRYRHRPRFRWLSRRALARARQCGLGAQVACQAGGCRRLRPDGRSETSVASTSRLCRSGSSPPPTRTRRSTGRRAPGAASRAAWRPRSPNPAQTAKGRRPAPVSGNLLRCIAAQASDGGQPGTIFSLFLPAERGLTTMNTCGLRENHLFTVA